jgi:hypothetical protein
MNQRSWRWPVAVLLASVGMQYWMVHGGTGGGGGLEIEALAQDSCPDIPIPGVVQNIELDVKTPLGNCTLASGGYIKKLASYKYHFAATVTGGCTVKTLSCNSGVCTCVTTQNEIRNLGTTWLYSNASYFGSIAPSDAFTIQSLDTRVPTGTTNTGWAATIFALGKHTITSNTGWHITQCNLTPATISAPPFVVNVVACEPEWLQQGNPLYTPHLPSTTVQLYVPPELWDALVGPSYSGPAVLAASDVGTLMAGTGVTFQIVDADCGLDGDCIKIAPVVETPFNDLVGRCAKFTPTGTNPTTGEIRGYSDLWLNSLYWEDASADRLRRTVAHELTHGLGLHHNLCSVSDSIMSVPTAPSVYAACTQLTTGMAFSPRPSDVLPTVNSTYGDHVQSVCGF